MARYSGQDGAIPELRQQRRFSYPLSAIPMRISMQSGKVRVPRSRIGEGIAAELKGAIVDVRSAQSNFAFAALKVRRTRFDLAASSGPRHAQPGRAKRGGRDRD